MLLQVHSLLPSGDALRQPSLIYCFPDALRLKFYIYLLKILEIVILINQKKNIRVEEAFSKAICALPTSIILFIFYSAFCVITFVFNILDWILDFANICHHYAAFTIWGYYNCSSSVLEVLCPFWQALLIYLLQRRYDHFPWGLAFYKLTLGSQLSFNWSFLNNWWDYFLSYSNLKHSIAHLQG